MKAFNVFARQISSINLLFLLCHYVTVKIVKICLWDLSRKTWISNFKSDLQKDTRSMDLWRLYVKPPRDVAV